MGAAAIAARIQLRHAAPHAAGARVRGLAFDELGGPLIAVCGLAGGAGTSTLALALARQAAAASQAPVLLTEADPLRPGLATLAGRTAPHPLLELARRLADDIAPPQTFVELESGLRLVASRPRQCVAPAPDAVRVLLDQARAAHGLVIVDCGTSWTAASPILTAATHALWSMPANTVGIARARAVLDSDVMPPPGRSIEVLVAIAHSLQPRVSVRALRRLAAERCERLVLIPHSAAAAHGDRVDDDAVARTLDGLAPTLRSRP
jgi:hypothetical protein